MIVAVRRALQSVEGAERLYAGLAILLCVAMLAGRSVGAADDGLQGSPAMFASPSASGIVAASPGALVASAEAGAPAVAQQPADTDLLPAALPSWVQPVRAANLWSERDGGSVLQTLTQWQLLRVADGHATRLQVFATRGDGSPVSGWVEIADIGVSGPPPQWAKTTSLTPLYASMEGEGSVRVLRAGTPMVLLGEAAGGRLDVYVPSEPTEPRTGYGWVDADVASLTAPPLSPLLPAPGFLSPPLEGGSVYRVRNGDSVASIAAALRVTRSDVLRLSGVGATGRLTVGRVVRMPVPERSAAENSPGPTKVRDISPGLVSADYAIVVDGASGQILWARDANTPVAPASITKIVTALVVLDHARITDLVTARVDSQVMIEDSVMGLSPGEVLTVEDLLYGMMLPSGNDAALALAEYVGGTREAFVRLMNEKARSLGLTGSSFVNPHGRDAPGHLTTAYDMAMLARESMRNPIFQRLASARTYETQRGKGYDLANLNQLLWRYPGADGIKIGYDDAAGKTIVGSAVQNGHRVYVAMMRSADIFSDSRALLDWAFASYDWF